ncbi:MAG: hypothetical protein K1X79_11645 [Oligoflexia bacterium]|nr:hypothetical protein [Oligoflexia bacterium]
MRGYLCVFAFGAALLAPSGPVFAGPATFADKEREQRVAEVFNPLNPAGAVSGFSKELQMDPALSRVMTPNMFCRGPGGALIQGCGVQSGQETADWSGGVKNRAITVTSPNGLRSDLMMASTLANQYTTFLASALTQIATTFVYADAGAAAGLTQALANADGSRASYHATLQNVSEQAASDPIVGDQVAQALNGCINKQLSGAANGNQALALSMCLGDRTVSQGTFATTAGSGAKLGDIPDHAPTSPGASGGPSMPDTQHSAWFDVMYPKIKAAPMTSTTGQATKSELTQLLADAKRLTGDVVYTESNQLGSLLKSARRERNTNPADQPPAIYYSMMKKVWESGNKLLKKMCEHYNSYTNKSPSSYDPFSWWSGFGGATDFWDSLTSPTTQWTAPTKQDLQDLSFQSFRFTSIGGDLLFAMFIKSQEFVNPTPSAGQDPSTGGGRSLRCEEFETTSNKPGEFDRLLSNSGGSFSLSKLKEWRQTLFEVSVRIALGQWLNIFRIMHSFLMGVMPATAAAGSPVSYSLAAQLLFETVGVQDRKGLEEAFKNNRDELRAKFKLIEAGYSAELGRGAGSISEMFEDSNAKTVGSGSSFDRGTGGGS